MGVRNDESGQELLAFCLRKCREKIFDAGIQISDIGEWDRITKVGDEFYDAKHEQLIQRGWIDFRIQTENLLQTEKLVKVVYVGKMKAPQ
jgi:hypothetical protein